MLHTRKYKPCLTIYHRPESRCLDLRYRNHENLYAGDTGSAAKIQRRDALCNLSSILSCLRKGWRPSGIDHS
jgi:hypothetical protein